MSVLATHEQAIQIQTGTVTLDGDLVMPEHATGMVVFAHGSGSSRHSPRNRFVAQELQHHGLATLLMDLLTMKEEKVDSFTAELRFDVGLLAERLIGAADWLRHQPSTRDLKVGYFGASTGAGAALVAAAQRPAMVSAIVSRGGRPDLAGAALPYVTAPTLLVVGEEDTTVIGMNEQAIKQLQCEKQLVLIPHASHLFEEPGTLEQVAKLAREWFGKHLK